MQQIFSGTIESTLSTQVAILKKFTSGHTLDTPFPLPSGVETTDNMSLEHKNLHREHVLKLLVTNNHAQYSPHSIFALDSHCIRLHNTEKTLAYIQLDSDCRTEEIVAAHPQLMQNLIATALENYLAKKTTSMERATQSMAAVAMSG